MKKLDFHKEGTTLFYVNRDKGENIFYQLFYSGVVIFMLSFLLITGIFWITTIGKILLFLWFGYCSVIIMTEGSRPENSKYFITVINSVLYYEKITPEKEGFNPNNKLINFDIIKFIDDKEDVIKIISNNILPWGNRKVHISKEYLPYKKQIIDYLNENYTTS